MGYALIDEEKLETLLKGQERLEAMLINLQPVKPEPDKAEHWAADRIAKASGLHPETIKQKIRDLRIPTVKQRPVTIEYRHIAKLGLKIFDLNK